MTQALPFAIWLLTLSAWMGAAILVRAAWRKPRVGALTERASVAVGLAIFGTIYSVAVVNTELIHMFDVGTMVNVVRAGVVIVLLLPAWWSFLYLTDRLGGGE